jgi:hypothetical protein
MGVGIDAYRPSMAALTAATKKKHELMLVCEPAARMAGVPPALHSLARKTWERGRLARFVGLDTSDLSINVLLSAT